MGLRPDGDAAVAAEPTGQPGQHQSARNESHFTLADALRTSSFWFLTIGTALRVVTLTAVTVHYVPIMVWKGLSQTEAAFLLGVQAFMGLPTTLLFGWLADRVNKPKLMAVCMLFAMLALLILIFSEKEWQIWFFFPLFSLVESTFPVNWSTVGEFFGCFGHLNASKRIPQPVGLTLPRFVAQWSSFRHGAPSWVPSPPAPFMIEPKAIAIFCGVWLECCSS